MKEMKYTLSDIQRGFIPQLHNMLNSYYTKGYNSYTTHMGFTIGMRDCISLLDSIVYDNHYTNEDKHMLNEIRSMYISLKGVYYLPYP